MDLNTKQEMILRMLTKQVLKAAELKLENEGRNLSNENIYDAAADIMGMMITTALYKDKGVNI